ncbi:MAG: hypothetical protein JSR59_08935, partial [Proteobacteria bacterium]|nr:hypothetical protein [Pseudomonadota bacterium]
MRLACAAALCMAAFGSVAQGPAQDKPATAAAPAPVRSWVATQTRAHTLAYAIASDRGALAETERIHIAVALKLRNKDALDALTAALMSGRTSSHLSSQQFLDRHAPTREQAVRVV